MERPPPAATRRAAVDQSPRQHILDQELGLLPVLPLLHSRVAKVAGGDRRPLPSGAEGIARIVVDNAALGPTNGEGIFDDGPCGPELLEVELPFTVAGGSACAGPEPWKRVSS